MTHPSLRHAARPIATRRAWLATALAASLLSACGGGGSSGTPGGGGCGGAYGSMCPTAGYTVTALVTDGTTAANQDANLVNAWGVAFNPTGYVWVANNGTGTSTLYDGNGVAQSLVVTLPAGAAPTGIIYNGSTDFSFTVGAVSAPAVFAFASEGGTLSAWSPSITLTQAYDVVDNGAAGAIYKGLAVAATGSTHRMYAADFGRGEVDVFDATFAPITVAGGFVDATLPAGYAPFNVQAFGDKVYVAYAKKGAGPDEVDGAGLGLVDVFDTDGVLVTHLVATGGALDAPWGMAMAPATGFGDFSGKLLVGNFGNGWIEAYDPVTGTHAGTLTDKNGTPLHIDGLWGLAFGNGVNAQPTTTLFYAAGPGGEAHGAYGKIVAN
jgi:uncharacterized protein (TIGR03118 family)